MTSRRVDPERLREVARVVIEAVAAGTEPPAEALRDAVRLSLAVLAATVPGRAIEVRVPPYGAVQCGAGPRHTRGQPSNVVETDPVTWVRLAAGELDWKAATASGGLRASGERSDLSPHLPLLRVSRGGSRQLR